MQPYRTAKPHAGTETACPACTPHAAGHHLCQADGCNEIAIAQAVRHATLAEYLDLPEALRPIDAVAHRAVFGCDEHAEDAFEPFCDHTPNPAPPCPKCGADGEDQCLRKDGATPRSTWHAVRPTPAQPDPCAHAHREDCDVFDGCQCGSDDVAPERPARPRGATLGPDISGLTIPLLDAQILAARNNILWAHVTTARSMLTQDNRPAVAYEMRQYDTAGNLIRDEHGHETRATALIPLDLAA